MFTSWWCHVCCAFSFTFNFLPPLASLHVSGIKISQYVNFFEWAKNCMGYLTCVRKVLIVVLFVFNPSVLFCDIYVHFQFPYWNIKVHACVHTHRYIIGISSGWAFSFFHLCMVIYQLATEYPCLFLCAHNTCAFLCVGLGGITLFQPLSWSAL